MPRTPLSTRIAEFACIAFALWTLCCHAVVAAGGTLTTLMGVAGTLATVALGLTIALRRRASPGPVGGVGAIGAIGAIEVADRAVDLGRADAPAPPTDASPVPASPFFSTLYSLLGFVLPVAGAWVALSLGPSEDKIPLWWGWILVMLGAAFLALRPLPWRARASAPRAEPPVHSAPLELGLFGLALVCVAIALAAHRPDVDDSFYLNLAVGAVDRASWPLLSSDTLHGIEGLPLHLPVYRLHSYELLNAALSRLSGLPVIACFHIVSAALGAALVPLCFAALWRQLTPRHWLWGVAATLLVLVAAGETHRSYGNFSLVRIWQGKAIALYVFLPLVHAYAIRFALRPGLWNAVLLAAAQIAALGCSASSLWLAPLGAAIAMASALDLRWHSLRSFALGMSTSAYLVLAGLTVKAPMSSVAAMDRPFDAAAQLRNALAFTLGSDALLVVSLASILAAWACWPSGLARRYAVAFPLAVGALLLDPYLADFVHRHVTGPSFWRAMWALPVPVLLALAFTAPLQLRGSAFRRAAGLLLCGVLMIGFAVFVPRYSTLSVKNRVSLEMPRFKVDPLGWSVARDLNAGVPSRARVVAPQRVARWLPAFHDHAYPMLVAAYLNHARNQLGEDDFDLRRKMTSLASGQAEDPAAAAEAFERGLSRYDIAAVCLRKTGQASWLRPLLERRGFEQTLDRDAFEIWLRADHRARAIYSDP